MDILPEIGGRVVTLCFDGVELLSGEAAHGENWGATYWTSPQSDWGWPPVREIDSAVYEILEGGEGVCVSSPLATIGPRQFHIIKRFFPGAHPDTIDTEYVIENRGTQAFSMASWEISRVRPGGLTFFPTGVGELNPVAPHSELPIEKVAGTTFYDHAQFELGKCLKLHADGQGGYLAHLAGSHLILKMFSDTQPEAQAPGEGECEIFAMDGGQYVEVEVQGPYVAIAPGKSSLFSVRTAVVSLPPALTRGDRAGLRAFADERVRALR
jgi:hypothetical protein